MSKFCYVPKNFQVSTLMLIEQCNTILEDYSSQGYDLTLRQLYYQFVARDLFPDSWKDKNPPHSKNIQKNASRLGSIVNNARLAGLIDWSHIVDRTRELKSLSHWANPEEIIDSAAASYRIDMWLGQEYYVECWVEKDALIGVVADVCNMWDVPYFSCRGYTSQSEMWKAAGRFQRKYKKRILIHLSDHDPSGLDMEKDIEARFEVFGVDVSVERIALLMDQVNQYSLPPNPAKITDSRYASYADQHGTSSWELDALDPSTLSKLIDNKIQSYIDSDRWIEAERRKDKEKGLLEECSNRWAEVVDLLEPAEE